MCIDLQVSLSLSACVCVCVSECVSVFALSLLRTCRQLQSQIASAVVVPGARGGLLIVAVLITLNPSPEL